MLKHQLMESLLVMARSCCWPQACMLTIVLACHLECAVGTTLPTGSTSIVRQARHQWPSRRRQVAICQSTCCQCCVRDYNTVQDGHAMLEIVVPQRHERPALYRPQMGARSSGPISNSAWHAGRRPGLQGDRVSRFTVSVTIYSIEAVH
jgi:hypothetical protein